jgi:hypothetical protein
MLREPILEPISLKQTRFLLESSDRRPSKQLEQNFLVDENIAWKLLQPAQLHPEEHVIEIGSGLRMRTRALFAQ